MFVDAHPAARAEPDRRRVATAEALVTLLLAACLAGCASLPAKEDHRPSVALADTRGTPLAVVAARSVAGSDNGFKLLPEPASALQTRIALIDRAERTLDLQYFIWNADYSGRALMVALRDAGLRGVRVRLLLDDLYTSDAEPWLQALSGFPNVEVRLFNPFPSGRQSFASRILASLGDISRVRHRMHNKLFVADNVMAITGGRNVGDEYLASDRGNFFDIDMLAVGPIVREMSDSFDDYWNSDQAYDGAAIWGRSGAAQRREAFDRLLQQPVARPRAGAPVAERLRGYTTAAEELAAGRVALQVCQARLFADPVEKAAGTSLEDSSATLHQRLIQTFAASQQEIYIVSPYFVRGKVGLERIKALADRGVRLRVLTNSLASTDEPLAHLVYLRYRHALLRLGVELREYAALDGERPQPPPPPQASAGISASRLHAKLAVVDRRWLYIGSLNFTSRSERVNTELGVILDCPVLAHDVLELVDAAPAYDLRLARHRAGIEWVDRRRVPEQVLAWEPEATLWQRLKSTLLNPFVPEQEI